MVIDCAMSVSNEDSISFEDRNGNVAVIYTFADGWIAVEPQIQVTCRVTCVCVCDK